MALMWLSLDRGIIAAMRTLAGFCGDPDEWDVAWQRAGLPVPPDGAWSRVRGPYTRHGAVLDAGGGHDIEVNLRPGGQISTLLVKFAVFAAGADVMGYADSGHSLVLGRDGQAADAGEQLATFRCWGVPGRSGESWFQPLLVAGPTGAPDGEVVPRRRSSDDNVWRLDRSAGYRDFDAVWRQAQAQTENLLGPAAVVGRHQARRDAAPVWYHAAWRLGGCVLAVLQADDDVKRGWEAAYLAVTPVAPELPIPCGDELYATMLADSLVSPRTDPMAPDRPVAGDGLWEQVRQMWNGRLTPVDPSLISPALPEHTRHFLARVGLPTDFLNVRTRSFVDLYHDQRLLDTVSRNGHDYLSIGRWDYVDISTGRVYDDVDRAIPRLLSSSVPQLVATLGLIDAFEAVTRLGERHVRQLEKQLTRLDPPAMAPEHTSWPLWIDKDLKD